MALDFPSSPTNGQVYGDYYYDSTTTAWRSSPTTTGSVPTGAVFQWVTASAPTGYLVCDGSTFSSTTYSGLALILGDTYGTHSGTTYYLPDLRSRVSVGSQDPTSLGTATITIATPGVVTRATHGLSTGQVVYLTTTGALPTGLTASTRYWVNVVTSSTFTLATSLANALAGTVIATSGTQSGTHTVYSADFDLGRSNGEKNHTQTTTELVSHTHTLTNGATEFPSNASSGTNYTTQNGVSYGFKGAANANTGGGLPMNNMQPYLTMNYIIKT